VFINQFIRTRTTSQLSTMIQISNFMELSPSWEAAGHADTQEFPNVLWNGRFITVFTGALHWSLSWARWIQSILPHPIFVRSTLILSPHMIQITKQLDSHLLTGNETRGSYSCLAQYWRLRAAVLTIAASVQTTPILSLSLSSVLPLCPVIILRT
jgi:hypothetical protein